MIFFLLENGRKGEGANILNLFFALFAGGLPSSLDAVIKKEKKEKKGLMGCDASKDVCVPDLDPGVRGDPTYSPAAKMRSV